MTESERIVKKLRYIATYSMLEQELRNATRDAANLIEEQEKRIEKLEKELQKDK